MTGLKRKGCPDNAGIDVRIAPVYAVSEYCRKKGLFPEQIQQWKHSCISGNQSEADKRKQQAQERKADKKRIKELERELKRKDAALAETAALLVLRKKLNAYWGEDEDN